jgi:hypothetical protein
MMPTFKQFLFEGGAATKKQNTERANKQDMEAALEFVSKHTGISYDELVDNLLGTGSHTLTGKRVDSGDIDIAFEEGKHNREDLVDKMQKATGMDTVRQTAGHTYSFAVPTIKDKKVQVDFMFVPSLEWAKFSFHASADSKFKSATRAILLMSTMKQMYETGKDIQVKDAEGNDIVRVRRAFKSDMGLERLFNIAPMRKDGKGRTALKKVTPAEVEAELRRIGHMGTFSNDADPIRDPRAAAEFMFGKGTKPESILSAEGAIKQIFKRPDHAIIFKNAIADMEKADLPIPTEIAQFK